MCVAAPPKILGYTAHLFHPGSNQRFGPENPAGFHPKNLHIPLKIRGETGQGDLVEGYIISVSGSKDSVRVRYLVEGYILLVLR
jgi:hypothetical protein